MITRAWNTYKSAFSGLSKEVWWLSIIMLINRSGSMVLPFLSLYLVHHLHFSTIQASFILTAFGLGSMCGALVGGWLADRTGYFRIQLFSLLGSGIGWLILIQVNTFWPLLILIFCQSTILDMLRPANSSAISNFASKENLTRSYSLNRMAMNLGYSVGPFAGGILATISYQWLFIVDSITCISAALVLYIIFKKYFSKIPKEQKHENRTALKLSKSPWQDIPFLIFTVCVILFSTVFFQLIFTLPLYYKEDYGLDESMVGILMGLNGLFIVILEMVFVNTIGKKVKAGILVTYGVFLTGVSFIMLNFFHSVLWLLLSMLILCFAEIMSMPFMITYVNSKAPKVRIGSYMAMYSFAFSLGLILAPYFGMRIIQYYGFNNLWNWCFIISLLTASILYLLLVLKAQKSSHSIIENETL